MPASRVYVIDSHTAGEPTRVVVSGGPLLGSGSMQERLARFKSQHDYVRSAVVNEPRGSDVLVGALLLPASGADCTAGVIFFNNVGYIGMCGHGTIGVVTTLSHLGKIKPGAHRLETPVGVVTTTLHADGSVSLENVVSYRAHQDVSFEVPGFGPVRGEIAWGGNWFFLVSDHGQALDLAHVEELTSFTWAIRQAVNAQGHPEIDHIELTGPARLAGSHARNFVLCPGRAYDRSPCGTGTSAKLACLAADGALQEGAEWVQESILGTTFLGRYRWENREQGRIVPTIIGRAYITAEATLILADDDPFVHGIAPHSTIDRGRGT
jgi:4-hydroxyproline epimerase